jgi:hypothetical protein
LEQLKVSQDTIIHVIHMTDAPPHTTNLDREGRIEKETLKNMFEIKNILQRLKMYVNLRYTCLTTDFSSTYVHLAHHLNGSVHMLNNANGDISSGLIIGALRGIFNMWMPSLGEPIGMLRRFIKNPTSVNTDESDFLSHESGIHTTNDTGPSCISLMERLIQIEMKIVKDSSFKDNCFDLMIEIAKYPLALTIVPLLGKLYRELMKERSDPRREILVQEFNRGKGRLSPQETKELETWNANTFNSCDEIKEIIKECIEKTQVDHVITYNPRNVPQINTIVHTLSNPFKEGNAKIREMLSEFSILSLKIRTIEELPPNCLPVNMNLSTLFSILMHIVSPGTMLSRRCVAVLSLHIVQSGHFLSNQATEFLNQIKGNWINWKRDQSEEKNPQIPECYNPMFIKLLLDPSTAFALTQGEYHTVRFFQRVIFARYFFNLTISPQVLDPKSLDGYYPDNMAVCTRCEKECPMSLLNSNQICGYCMANAPCPDWDSTHVLQVRCAQCGGIYARDSNEHIPGSNKCHFCRESQKSPLHQCKKCNYMFIQQYMRNKGLPKGMCAACQYGMPIRASGHNVYVVAASSVLIEYLPMLLDEIGLKLKPEHSLTCKMSLAESVLQFDIPTRVEKITINDNNDDDDDDANFVDVNTESSLTILHRNKQITNLKEIWKYVVDVMTGRKEREFESCCLCLESFSDKGTPLQLVPACDRTNCSQKMCLQCCNRWYGSNSVGSLLHERSLTCPLCARRPSDRTFSRIDSRLIMLENSCKNLNAEQYYGWCRRCIKPGEICARVCARDAPQIENFMCNVCKAFLQTDVNRNLIKKCPMCSQETEKTGGCNHITCNCGCHWCWICEWHNSDHHSNEGIYDHLMNAHGRIFD